MNKPPKKTVLLLGNGGREHAWAVALARSGADIISWAPRINPGIFSLAKHIIEHPYTKDKGLLKGLEIDLAVIGPEAPLVEGITDWLHEQGITVFSPSQKNAMIEGSKAYMRRLLQRHGIEGNIKFAVCNSREELQDAIKYIPEFVVKPDGLTGGKGVKVYGEHLPTIQEALEYAMSFIENGEAVVIEEKVEGTEFSLQALVAGENTVFLPLVRDYKRAYDGDTGPNTGSMGAISFPDHDLPYISEGDVSMAKQICSDVLRALKEENGDYVGAIYGQFMLTDDGAKVIEFNARLGDPEAINTLELLETPLLEIIEKLMNGKIPEVKFKEAASCVVYMVPKGYPENPEEGARFTIPADKEIRFASVTGTDEGSYVTSRSRSIAVVGTGRTLTDARNSAYVTVQLIQGLRSRTDIGAEYCKN